MSTLVVTPLSPPTDPGDEEIRLDIIAKSSDFAGFFDLLEIWRSFDSSAGPYSEITADEWKPARLPAGAGDIPVTPVTGPFAVIVGKTLVFLLDDTDTIVITFTGTDPLTRAAAASQIIAQSGARLDSYVDATGVLVVQTTQPGTGALLELTGGDAAGELGLALGSRAYGRDARIPLANDQELYTFVDQRGESTAFYKTRYRNRTTNATSDFSQPFGGGQVSALSDTSLVIGIADLVDVRGRPLAFREIRIHTDFNGILVDGRVMAGGDIVVKTDVNGHVEVPLVRGQSIAVGIAGTDLVRDITVPTDPAVVTFNLMDPALAGPDIFKVQVPDIIYAERRTL